jgi:hypothetical protein
MRLKIGIYETIYTCLPVVLHGCETWSLTLREEHRLRLFENRLLRKIFGPKRDEVMGGRSKLHNKELRDLYFSPKYIQNYQIEDHDIREAHSTHGEKRNAYRLLQESQKEREH